MEVGALSLLPALRSWPAPWPEPPAKSTAFSRVRTLTWAPAPPILQSPPTCRRLQPQHRRQPRPACNQRPHRQPRPACNQRPHRQPHTAGTGASPAPPATSAYACHRRLQLALLAMLLLRVAVPPAVRFPPQAVLGQARGHTQSRW